MYFAPKIYPGFLFGANADAAFADSVHGDANDVYVTTLYLEAPPTAAWFLHH